MNCSKSFEIKTKMIKYYSKFINEIDCNTLCLEVEFILIPNSLILEIENKVIVITGGSGGIGQALAKSFIYEKIMKFLYLQKVKIHLKTFALKLIYSYLMVYMRDGSR